MSIFSTCILIFFQEKVSSCNKKNSSLLNTLQITKDTPVSSPDVLGSNRPCVEEPIEVPPQIKSVGQKYSRTRGKLPKTYKKNGEPHSSSVNTTPDIVEITSICPDVKQCVVKKSRRPYYPKTKLKNTEPQTLHSNSYPIVLEPDISCDQDVIEITPQIQQVSQTYSQTKGRSTKSYEKKAESCGLSVNPSPDTSEIVEIVPEVKQCGVPKYKRLCKAKLRNIKPQTQPTSSNRSVLESNSSGDDEPIEDKRPYKKPSARTYSRNKKGNDSSQNTSANSCRDETETNNDTPQVKARVFSIKTRKRKTSSNSNADDLELNLSTSKKPTKNTPQKKNVVQTGSRTKEKLSETCDENEASQSSSINTSPVIPEPKTRFLPKRQCRAKRRNSVELIGESDSEKDSSWSVLVDSESSGEDIQIVKEVSSKTKRVAQKCKKARSSVSYGEELQGNSSNSNRNSDNSMDYLPLITESCKNRLKVIVSTAVQIQRHSHRQSLTEADFIQSLVFHNCFEESSNADIAGHETDSELSRIDQEFIPFACQGKWLRR